MMTRQYGEACLLTGIYIKHVLHKYPRRLKRLQNGEIQIRRAAKPRLVVSWLALVAFEIGYGRVICPGNYAVAASIAFGWRKLKVIGALLLKLI